MTPSAFDAILHYGLFVPTKGGLLMLTEYDKAIAGFLTSLIGLAAAFRFPLPFLTPEVILAVTPFITMVVVWLVPNKAPGPTAPSSPPASKS